VETNREALRRLGRQARIEIANQPAWMRTPPREPISRRQEDTEQPPTRRGAQPTPE
jgi:hypothetical protein